MGNDQLEKLFKVRRQLLVNEYLAFAV